MKFGKLNFLAVLIVVVVSLGIGFSWFGPLFGEAWMELVGLTEKDAADAGYMPLVIAVVGTILGCVLLTALLKTSDETGAVAGIKWGVLLWLLLLLPLAITGDSFGQVPLKLTLIESGEQLVSLIAMGAILGAMPAKG